MILNHRDRKRKNRNLNDWKDVEGRTWRKGRGEKDQAETKVQGLILYSNTIMLILILVINNLTLILIPRNLKKIIEYSILFIN